MKIMQAILLGSAFGFALFYAGASDQKKLLSMLQLKDLSLMKIILFAIGLSSVFIYTATAMGVYDPSHFSIKAMNMGVVLGGILFGLGFGAVGSCPGTCVAASSSGALKKSIAIIAGGLVGAFLFSLLYGSFDSLGLFKALDYGKMTLFNLTEKFPSMTSIGPIGLLVSGILFMSVAIVTPKEVLKK